MLGKNNSVFCPKFLKILNLCEDVPALKVIDKNNPIQTDIDFNAELERDFQKVIWDEN